MFPQENLARKGLKTPHSELQWGKLVHPTELPTRTMGLSVNSVLMVVLYWQKMGKAGYRCHTGHSSRPLAGLSMFYPGYYTVLYNKQGLGLLAAITAP